MQEKATRLKFERFFNRHSYLRYCDIVDQDTGNTLRIQRFAMPREKSPVAVALVLFGLMLALGAGVVAHIVLLKDENSYIPPVGLVLFSAVIVLLVIFMDPPWRFQAVRSGGDVAFELMPCGSRWVRRRRFSAHGANGQAVGWLMRTSLWPPARNWACYAMNGEALCQTVLSCDGLGVLRRCLALVCPGRFGVYQYESHGRTVGTYDCWHSTLSLADAEALPLAFAISMGAFLNTPYWA